MPKVKYMFILAMLLSMGLCVPAGAQCWRWEKKDIPGAPQWDHEQAYLVFNEAIGKMTLTINRYDEGLEMWIYDRTSWIMESKQVPELPSITGGQMIRQSAKKILLQAYTVILSIITMLDHQITSPRHSMHVILSN